MKRNIAIITLIVLVFSMLMLTGASSCEEHSSGTYADTLRTQEVGDNLQDNQPTPTDIDYSLERYNLIRRTYWVNGQREKANTLPCEVEKPLGYVILFTESGQIINKFTVDGKISSLNSFLTPDSEYYEESNGGSGVVTNEWLPDVDGSYGENDNGIFFFTPDGKYIEWNGKYLYSDIPFELTEQPVVEYKNSDTKESENQ